MKTVNRILLLGIVVGIGCIAWIGITFLRDAWRTASSPISAVTDAGRTILGRGERDVEMRRWTSSEERKKAIDDLALIAAYDSLMEINSLRPRVMEEIVKVVVRMHRANPNLKIPKILEGASSWLPENWDASGNAWVMWRDRERPRMLAGVTQADMHMALALAEKWADRDPGEGPLRYARPKRSLLDPKRLMAWADGESRAANALAASMNVDPELAKLGAKTVFYRPRTKR